MRIIGGKFGGRTLAAPPGAAVRPTSDRVREAIFNILAHGIGGFAFEGAGVLDLFAGTGALGIEALSRGAAHCLFVEQAAPARAAIRRNVEALGLTGVSKIFRRDASNLGAAGRHGGAALAFLDPPYGQGFAERTLLSLSGGGWLAAGALVVIEEGKSARVELPPPYAPIDQRAWGDTQVLFVRFTPSPSGA
jgi:16S rRNA (guanine966-N2)-methyltransferase